MELVSGYKLGQAPELSTLLRQGWAPPEADFVWSMAAQAVLEIPHRAGEGLLFIELALAPLTSGTVLAVARLCR